MKDTLTITNENTPCPVAHQFSDGVYARTIFMPKGTTVIGKVHKTKHLNFIMTGEAWLLTNGELTYIKAPFMLESQPNVRKVLQVVEDMYWTTVHATDEQDIEILESTLVEEQSPQEVKRELENYMKRLGE